MRHDEEESFPDIHEHIKKRFGKERAEEFSGILGEFLESFISAAQDDSEIQISGVTLHLRVDGESVDMRRDADDEDCEIIGEDELDQMDEDDPGSLWNDPDPDFESEEEE